MKMNTANITLKNSKGVYNFKSEKVRFSANCCFAFDRSEDDQHCFEALGRHLINNEKGLAFYECGDFFKELIRIVPDLKSHIHAIILDDPDAIGTEIESLPVISPNNLPDSIKTVFLCNTQTFPCLQMRKKLPKDLKVLTPDLILEIAEEIIPKRAWVPFIESIYPIDIPDIEFQTEQDLILIDCPSRNLSFMPNGLGYVHNAIKKTNVKFQTLDLDIIMYHRYHMYRILDTYGKVTTPEGYDMPEDPWAVEAYEAWQEPETMEYFRSEINEIIAGLVKAKPKILGLSIQACNINFSKEVVKGVKEALPDTLILVGGFSCYQSSVGLRAFPLCDYMIIGEADLNVGDLVEKLARGERPTGLAGVMSRFDPPNITFLPSPMPENLDHIEMPQYEWFDLNVYKNFNHYQLTPVIASRGCRWSLCTFCAERFHWRIRSPKNVVDELEWLTSKGCDLFMFNESDFNGRPEIVLDICDEIIRRGLKVRLTGQLRIHRDCTRAFFDKLHKAGFVSLRFGVDAWSRHTLKLQVKGYTPARITQNLKDCTEAGIFNEVNTVIGVPGETEQDINESIELIIKNKPNIGRIANINPLLFVIGSVYWEEPEKYNIKFRSDKEFLYKKFTTIIPSEIWYSTNPYIDEHVRKARFEKVVMALHENGFQIGDMAEQVINDVKEGRGAEAHARPDAESFNISTQSYGNEKHATRSEPEVSWPKSPSRNITHKQHRNNPAIQEGANDSSKYRVFKFKKQHYRVNLKAEGLNDSSIDFDSIQEAGPLSKIWQVFHNLRNKFFPNKNKLVHYYHRSINILKIDGINGFLKKVKEQLAIAKRERHLVINTGDHIQITPTPPNDLQLISEGTHGYNIVRRNGNVYGIRQGHPFFVEWVEENNYEHGTLFQGTSVQEVQLMINNYLGFNEANVTPSPSSTIKTEYLRRTSFDKPPLFSFILLDWSVRESFHTLDYLSHQKVDPNIFEVIWVEHYNRRSEQIDQRINKNEQLGIRSPVDTWIVMHHPETEVYHKHIMYNQGIIDAAGSIVVILDSDAVLRTDFIKTLIEEYENQPDIVLHFEQIRNFDKKFYPFNFPSLESIIGKGCVNATNGVPHGFDTCAKSLKDDWTLWNRYNYGACFSARREDLIRIGGADEHIDYMGHICGPYEMTARLINAGLQDKLHPTHFLYHAWHPNQGGSNNYSGPNDGKGMSLTAMEIPKTGQIQPLQENGNIKKLRLAQERTAYKK
jgi:radical SAM superfamily enzyme YgiQ (UPF0313 family)